MWELLALGSLLALAFQNIIDKGSLIKYVEVDFTVASFLRTVFFFFFITSISYLIFPLRYLHFSFNWLILIAALFGVISSLSYTLLLKKMEITTLTSYTYLAPLFFLFIDAKLLDLHFTPKIIIGIFLLVFGGVGFTFNFDLKSKKMRNTIVFACFFFTIIWNGCLAYLFKYLNLTEGINGVSFFSSLWFLNSLILLLMICIKAKSKLLFQTPVLLYMKRVAVSKFFDAISTILWVSAIGFVAVSRLSAFEALYPLILLLFVIISQKIFKLDLGENLEHKFLFVKIFSTIFLVIGGLLVA